MPISKQKAAYITETLKKRGALKPCEICGASQFTLLEEFLAVPALQPPSPSDFHALPPALPAAAMFCNRCGNLRFHHLAVLGLKP